MIPKPAQYLLRFDDLCPTVPRDRWEPYCRLIESFKIHPIIAVVPDNKDPELNHSPYDSSFWESLRTMEAAGATIAVHGLQHLCRSLGPSLLGLHRKSEFAGVDLKTQREWIRTGFSILREKGLNPRLWIAPRHGFDRNTLRALQETGVRCISDGFARTLHLRYGITWIPQQLWAPMVKKKGLWTICLHPCASRTLDVERLQWFLEDHGPQFTSFERVLREFDTKPLVPAERIREQVALWRVRRRNLKRRRRSQRSSTAAPRRL